MPRSEVFLVRMNPRRRKTVELPTKGFLTDLLRLESVFLTRGLLEGRLRQRKLWVMEKMLSEG